MTAFCSYSLETLDAPLYTAAALVPGGYGLWEQEKGLLSQARRYPGISGTAVHETVLG